MRRNANAILFVSALLLSLLGADSARSPSQCILGATRHALSAAKESHYQHTTHLDEGAATDVGRGTLWIVTDPEGRPTPYHWSLKTGKPHPIDIAIGRAVEPD